MSFKANDASNGDFSFTYNYVCRDHPEMTRHRHRDFELIHIISGSMKLYIYVDNVKYPLSAGDIVIIKGNLSHAGNINNGVYESVLFDIDDLRTFNTTTVSKLIQPLKSDVVNISPVIIKNNSKIYSIALEIFAYASRKPKYYELALTGRLFNFFYYLYKEGYIKQSPNNIRCKSQIDVVDAAVDYIAEHISEHISLSDLADISQMNEKYFCRLFKEKTGYTPIDYVNRTKIEIACNLLTNENLPVTDVAIKSGFDDISYFTRLFKRYRGVTPTEYKKQKGAEFAFML